MTVLILNFNNVDIINFFEKNQKLHIWILTFTLKMTSCKTMKRKKKWKKNKNQDSKGKKNFFLNTLPFSPMVVLAMWLHVGAPQKIHKKWT